MQKAMSDKAIERARMLRYTRPAPAKLSYYDISAAAHDISDDCYDILWQLENDDIILDALDGNEDELHEFKLMFTELTSLCDSLIERVDFFANNELYNKVNDFLVGVMCNCNDVYDITGYDSYEDDYFPLDEYETEWAKKDAHKRLMRLTKAEILDTAGLCMEILLPYLDLQGQYDRLKASYEVVAGDTASLLQKIRDIDEAYRAADKGGWDEKAAKDYDRLLVGLPDAVWIY